MVICELCGIANDEQNESCRVCGQLLKLGVQSPAPPTPSPAPPAPLATSSRAAQPHEMSHAVEHSPHAALQMSAVKQAPQTGVPPMMSDRQDLEAVSTGQETTSVPGFMQSARAALPQPEPIQLISGNDLPDWIKQIAAADEAKAAAEAEAEALAHPADPVATNARPQLAGETQASGPSTSWLSKTGAATESREPWGSVEATGASWNSVDSTISARPATAPAVVPAPVFVPSTVDAYSYPKPKKRFALPARSKGTSSSITPVYRRQSVQLLTIAVLLILIVLVVL
jgi:hypothetical protein